MFRDRVAIADSRLGFLQKAQLRRRRQNTTFLSIAIKKSQAFEIVLVERVINVGSQVFANCFCAEVQASSPGLSNLIDVLQPVVARLLEDTGNVEFWIQVCQRRPADRPKSKDKGQVSPAPPLFRQIIDIEAGGLGLKRSITDQ